MSARSQAQQAYNRYKQAQKKQKKKKVVTTQTPQQEKVNRQVTNRKETPKATGNYSSFRGSTYYSTRAGGNPGRTSESSVQTTTAKRFNQQEQPLRRNQQELQRQKREHSSTNTGGYRMDQTGQERMKNLTVGAAQQYLGSQRKAISGFMSGITGNRAKANSYGGVQAHRNNTQDYTTRRDDRLTAEQLRTKETGIQKSRTTSKALAEAQDIYTKKESRAASKQIAKGTEKIEKGKEGLGAIGRFGADVYTGGLQLGMDMLAGGAVGGLSRLSRGARIATEASKGGMALAPMGVRAFGGAVDEAEQAGASWKQQMAYGGLTAGIELGSEKLFNVGPALNSAFGKGVGDELINKITKKAGESALKGSLKSIGAATVTEALEEMVAEGLEPMVANAIYADAIGGDAVQDSLLNNPKQALLNMGRAGLIGATLGAPFGVGGVVMQNYQGKKISEQATNIYGPDGIKALAQQGTGVADEKDAAFAQAVLESVKKGEGVANIQVARLQEIINKQRKADTDRMQSSVNASDKVIRENNYSMPTNKGQERYAKAGEEAKSMVSYLTGKRLSEDSQNMVAHSVASIAAGSADIDEITMALSSDEARTTVENVLGVDLRGKSYAEAKDALIDLTQFNREEAAREQTVYDDNLAKGEFKAAKTVFAAKGQSAFDEVFADKDARGLGTDGLADRQAVTFEAYYRAGQAGIPIDRMRQAGIYTALSTEDQKRAWDAGREDFYNEQLSAFSEAAALKRAVRTGSQNRGGTVNIDSLNEENRAAVMENMDKWQKIAQATGIDIVFDDNLVVRSKDGQNSIREDEVNGHFDPKNRRITLSMNNSIVGEENVVEYVFAHEFTHFMKLFAPGEYLQLKDFCRRWLLERGLYESKIDYYRHNMGYGDQMSEDEILDEIVCDTACGFSRGEGQEFDFDAFVSAVCGEDINVAKKIIQAIKDIVNKIRIALSGNQDPVLYKALDTYKEAQEKWYEGVRVATERRNAVGETTSADVQKSNRLLPETELKEILQGLSDYSIPMDKGAYKIGALPSIYSDLFDVGVLDLVIEPRHTYVALHSKEEAEKDGHITPTSRDHFHQYSVDEYYELIKSIEDPVAIYDAWTKKNDPKILVELPSEEIGIIRFYANSPQYGTTEEKNHSVLTIYKKKDPEAYIEKIAEKKLYEKSSDEASPTRLQLSDKQSSDELTNRLAQFNEKINKFKKNRNINYSRKYNDLVTLSEQRIDNLIDEYAIPGNTTSDYSKAWITSINPRDFLKLTISDEELEKWTPGSTNMWGQEVRDLEPEDLKAKGKYDPLMPFLKVNSSRSHSVTSHEGRHRMLALLRAGYEDVPVVIYDTSESAKSNRQYEERFDLWSQDHGDGPVNSTRRDEEGELGYTVDVYDLIPINEKNRAEIERMYGGDTEVQFSRKYTPEEQQEHRDMLLGECREFYGAATTEDYKESGYILPDGRMPKMGDMGIRGEDHLMAGVAYDDIYGADAQNQFISEGNIRFTPEILGFEMSQEPTEEQYDRIRKIIDDVYADPTLNMVADGIRIDFTDEDGRVLDIQVFNGTSADGIIGSIKAHFAGGTVTPMRQFLSRKDSEGRYLSEGQMEYFKDSKARDAYGHLIPVYHSSDEEFTEFDWDKRGDATGAANTLYGFFTSPNEEFSKKFGKNTKKMYANITNPIIHPVDCHLKYPGREDEIVRTWFETVDPYQIPFLEEIVENGDYDNIYDAYMGAFMWEAFDYADDERQTIENAGFDGIEIIEGENGEPISSFVVFNSNQLKDVDNLNPTESEDVRYSRRESDMVPDENYLKDLGSEVKFSRVTKDTTWRSSDGSREIPNVLQFLNDQEEAGDVVEVYRAMVMIDGKLYPPMATKWDNEKKGGRRKLQDPNELGEWIQSDERPDLITDFNEDGVGYFNLNKDNGDQVSGVAYNPYIHTSLSPLNDQFTSAYKRDNLVVVKGIVPKSELTSGYKAQYAKDAVGETEWHSGPVAGKLPGVRKVILARWFKPLEIMTDAEVADVIADTINKAGVAVPYNVVVPGLRGELEKRGVQIGEGSGNVPKAIPPLWSKEEENREELVTHEDVPTAANTYDVRYSLRGHRTPTVKSVIKEGGKQVGKSLWVDGNGAPLEVTTWDMTEMALREDGRGEKDIQKLKSFMDGMADFMEKMGFKYHFIGLEDVNNAEVEIRYDKNGVPKSVVLSAMIKNGEYPINFDFSSICKKRQAMSDVFKELSENYEDKLKSGKIKLTQENLWRINEVLRDEGFETACLGCFVEAKRYNIQEWASSFVEKWNAEVRKVNKRPRRFNFGKDQEIDFDAVDEALARFTANKKEAKDKKGSNLTNEETVEQLVKSGKQFQKLLTITDLITPNGIEGIQRLSSEMMGVLAGHYGSGTPKAMQGFTPYNSEIITLEATQDKNGNYKPNNAKLRQVCREIGGVRMQSFSDFLIANVFDYMQMIADLDARQLPAHAYTKEIAFAKIFGMTGIKINLSVMFDIDDDGVAAGLDKDGNYIIADEERARKHFEKTGEHKFIQSIPFAEAVELQNDPRYAPYIGTIGVGLSDEHIFKMLDDPDMRFIIPYHRSSLPSFINEVTKIEKATDYTSSQNTLRVKGLKKIDGVKQTITKEKAKEMFPYTDPAALQKLYSEKGSWQKVFAEFNKALKKIEAAGWSISYGKATKDMHGTGDFDVYTGEEGVDKTKNPKKTAEAYMGWCVENGWIPLFFQFAGHKNYYKVLYDFDPYNTRTGRYAGQRAVTSTYPDDVEDIIESYMKTEEERQKELKPKFNNAMKRIVSELENETENHDVKLSRKVSNRTEVSPLDEEYLAAVKRGDMETAQRMVNEAAARAGYVVRAYHGTSSYGFTEFRKSVSLNGYTRNRNVFGYGHYFSDVRDVAEHYAKKGGYIDKETGEIVEFTPGVYDVFLNLGNTMSIDWQSEIRPIGTQAEFDAYMDEKWNGRDSVSVRNVNDGVPITSTVYVVRNPEQIKSAEPVVYDDDGEVIPLSERFNEDNNNIRYSRKETLVNEDDVSDIMSSDPSIIECMYGWGMATPEGQNLHEQTKEELINKIEKMQQDMTITGGKVLDERSVREEMNKLVVNMGIEEDRWTGQMLGEVKMNKTNRGLVEDLVGTAKIIWRELQSGNYENAAISAMNVSEHVVDNLLLTEDTQYKEYKELVDYLRDTAWELNPIYHGEFPEGFTEFKKDYRGKIRIVKSGGRSPDELWGEMCELWPEFFTEDITNPAEMMKRMAEVRDSLQPYDFMLSEENQQLILRDAAADIIEIVSNGKPIETWADKRENYYREKIARLKARQQEAIRDIKKKQNWKEADRKLATEMAEGRKKAKGKRQQQEKKEERKEDRGKRQTVGKIVKQLDWLSDRLLKPTDDKHLPEGYRTVIAEMLASIDPQTERSKALEEKYGVSKKRFKWLQLRSEYEKIASGESYGFILDDQIMTDMQELSDVLGDGDFALANMTYDELQKVYRIVKSIRHGIQMQNRMFSDDLKGRAEDYGRNAIETAETYISEHGTGRKGVAGKIHGSGMPLFDEGMLTPRDYFEYIGGGLNEAFLALRRGQDEQIKKIDYMRSFFESIFRDYGKETRFRHRAKPGSELEAWRDGKHKKAFQCEGGTIELTPAQVMSLYCLMKREQAQGHILGSGIKASVVNKKNPLLGENLKEFFTGKGDKKTRGRRVNVTEEDIMNIVSTLTDEQRDIADKMQTLMSTVMSDWGNEASMKMFGYRKFTEENYFPIECERTYLATDFDVRQTAERVKNPNFAKSTQKGANNPVVIDDIFTVCADHCNRMAMYSAYAPAIADFQRVYNFVDRDPETGLQNGSVKESLQAAYGDRAIKYIERFMTDLNGTTPSTNDDLNRFVAKSLANYKKAAIGGNLRVAAQQPTAIIRALLYLSPKHFMGRMNLRKEIKDMKEHCPIALWKSWGFSQVDMARDLEDIMMNQEWSRFDMLTMEFYSFLDLVTWGQIWRAVKNEVKAENKDIETGSDEFYRLCNERASYIFDKSQVVDSVFHKSQVMRNTDVMSKMLTSFMAEPMRTFNMVGSEIQKAARMWHEGDKSGAMKVYTKAFNVFILNAATVSMAAAVVDMMRGKGGDDDDDDDMIGLIMQNFIENMKSNALPHTFIPFGSDIMDFFFNDFGASNMSLEGYEKMAKSIKNMFDEDKTWEEKIRGLVESSGYVFGIPTKNIMRELKTAMDILGIEVHAAEDSDEVEDVTFTDKFFGMFKDKDDKKSDKKSDKKDKEKDEEEEEELEDYIDTSNKHGFLDNIFNKMDIEEGGDLDKFLDRRGLTLTDEEARKKAINEKVAKVEKAAEGKTGDDKKKAIWTNATKGYTKYLEQGDIETIKEMRTILKKAGGDVDEFDEKVMSKCSSAYKKTIGTGDDFKTLSRQSDMRDYMIDHGMTEEQISSEIVYKSDTAKKFAVAAQEGKDKEAIAALTSLFMAGMTVEDAEKLWDNRWRYGGKGKSGHGSGQFSWPCSGPITSYFGRRNAPTAGASSNHPSIDIGVASGTQICAADGGVVIYTGYNGGYGNSVGIDHGNGYVTYYNHLSSWQVEKGAKIKKGQPIALSGSTGVSTGPHLDFKILKNGTPVNPMDYLN